MQNWWTLNSWTEHTSFQQLTATFMAFSMGRVLSWAEFSCGPGSNWARFSHGPGSMRAGFSSIPVAMSRARFFTAVNPVHSLGALSCRDAWMATQGDFVGGRNHSWPGATWTVEQSTLEMLDERLHSYRDVKHDLETAIFTFHKCKVIDEQYTLQCCFWISQNVY